MDWDERDARETKMRDTREKDRDEQTDKSKRRCIFFLFFKCMCTGRVTGLWVCDY